MVGSYTGSRRRCPPCPPVPTVPMLSTSLLILRRQRAVARLPLIPNVSFFSSFQSLVSGKHKSHINLLTFCPRRCLIQD